MQLQCMSSCNQPRHDALLQSRNKTTLSLDFLTFQWSLLGGPVTSPSSSSGKTKSSGGAPGAVVLSSKPASSRLSREPCRLLGGVIGDWRTGLSVGRRAAGTYRGDLGGRNCRTWLGSWYFRYVSIRGEVGEMLCGVGGAESAGEGCWALKKGS
jgi:hypothetical protein